ncbi:MAG: hypothetical protein MZU79_02020 [Anaerotruncus sp.]|nr:hypothetical protein [Anaerotruncus sp.]
MQGLPSTWLNIHTSQARMVDGTRVLSIELMRELVQKSAIKYSLQEHYDHASAFQKSLRGSDPNAAIYWLAKMISGGEDPRFIARRLIVTASEDVGNADPMALIIALNAFKAVETLGLPEGRILSSSRHLYSKSSKIKFRHHSNRRGVK